MSNEPMTLIERLRNPAWVHGPGQFDPATLDTDQTVSDMREAAYILERCEKEDREMLEWGQAIFERAKKQADALPIPSQVLPVSENEGESQ
jgi:hypothetical protein